MFIMEYWGSLFHVQIQQLVMHEKWSISYLRITEQTFWIKIEVCENLQEILLGVKINNLGVKFMEKQVFLQVCCAVPDLFFVFSDHNRIIQAVQACHVVKNYCKPMNLLHMKKNKYNIGWWRSCKTYNYLSLCFRAKTDQLHESGNFCVFKKVLVT